MTLYIIEQGEKLVCVSDKYKFINKGDVVIFDKKVLLTNDIKIKEEVGYYSIEDFILLKDYNKEVIK